MDKRITYYGKNDGPNSGGYHFASVRTMWGVQHVQEIGKIKTIRKAEERLRLSDETRSDNRKRLGKLQRDLNMKKITVEEAFRLVNTYPSLYAT